MEKKLLIGTANKRSESKADAGLLKLIARAHELQEIFTRGGPRYPRWLGRPA